MDLVNTITLIEKGDNEDYSFPVRTKKMFKSQNRKNTISKKWAALNNIANLTTDKIDNTSQKLKRFKATVEYKDDIINYDNNEDINYDNNEEDINYNNNEHNNDNNEYNISEDDSDVQSEGLNTIISEVFVHDDLLSGSDDDDDPDEDKNNEGNHEQIKTRLVCNGFNIFDYSIDKMKNSLIKLQKDDTNNLQKGSLKSEKGLFCRDILNWSAESSISTSDQTKLIKLLYKHLENVDLPVKISMKNNIVSTIKKYAVDDLRQLKFDVCPSDGCIAFIGDSADFHQCSICFADRYRPCVKCKRKDDFYGNILNCQHKNRIAYKSVYYRPIVQLIISLINSDLFLMFLNYNLEKLYDYDYFDVQHVPTFQKNMAEMEKKYQQFCDTNNFEYNSITMVRICLSQNYDGCATRKKRVTSFWPLIITILNLPPHLRIKLGIGMFVLSVFTSQLGSEAEEFLFRDLYVAELKHLYIGYLYENPINKKKYFIQVRLILSCFDTKAVEDHLHVHSSNSLAGCFMCENGKGLKINSTKTVVFIGNRQILHQHHVLRNFGQSGLCCPQGYYNDFQNKFVPLPAAETLSQKAPQTFTIKKNPNKTCLTNINDYNDLVSYLKNKKAPWVWHHKEFKINDFENDLWYHHCDYRDNVEHKRKTNQMYKNNASLLLLKENKKRKHMNGVKSLWNEAELPNVDVENDLNWDPFHVLNNIMHSLFDHWKGKRLKTQVMDFCKSINTHTSLCYNDKKKLVIKEKWGIPEIEWNMLDFAINSIIVPTGFTNEFQIKNIFIQTGYVSGAASILILVSLMPFIMYLCKDILDTAYIKFYLLLCVDIRDLMAPCFINNELEELHDRITELVSLHEGMFPITESKIIWHQLIDLPYHIRKWGMLKLWWAMPGERCLHPLKKHLPLGGQNNDLTLMNRYAQYELERLRQAYTKPVNAELRKDVCIEENFEIDYSEEKCIYSDIKFYLCKAFFPSKDLQCIIHNDYELNRLLTVMILEIKKKTKSLQEAVSLSPTFRIFVSYNNWKSKNNKKNKKSFYEFVVELYYKTNENDQKAISDLIGTNIVQSDDIYVIVDCLNNLQHPNKLYTNAQVYGIKMNGRGYKYKEEKEPIERYKYGQPFVSPSNRLNQLTVHWNKGKEVLSSWFTFRYHDTSLNNFNCDAFNCSENKIYKQCYGQFNYFFRINSKKEILLHNVPIASVTQRNLETQTKYQYITKYLNKISTNDSNSFNPDISFVSLSDVYSTKFLLCAFNAAENPIPLKIISVDPKKTKAIGLSRNYNRVVDHLLLIDMYPHRKKIMFGFNDYKEMAKRNYDIRNDK